MATSSVTYEGDGVIRNFSVPFPYILQAHILVEINETLRFDPLDYSWLTASSIRFTSAPADGAAIVIKRRTPLSTRLVDFQNGAVLTEADLDLSANQNFYLIQESQEGLADLWNAELIRVASANGVVETDPALILTAMVATALDQEAAADLAALVQDISANGETILELEVSLANAIDTIESGGGRWWFQIGEPIPGVDGVPDPIADGARWYDSDDDNHPYIYEQDTLTWLDLLDPRVGVNANDITSLEVTVDDPVTGVTATATALSILDTTVVNHSSVSASWFALLGAVNGAVDAWILDTATVKIDLDSGDTMATRYTALATSDSNNAAAISAETGTRIAADSIIAFDVGLMGARNGASTAFIFDSSTVKIDTDQGDTFATRLSTIATDIGDNTALISTEATTRGGADDTISAKYGVSLNVNGYITGFLQISDGDSGEFVILADKFSIVHPSGDESETEYIPFTVHDGAVFMDNAIIREVHFGQTGYDTGVGYWLGDDGGTAKFSIGNSAGNKMTWDGTTLEIVGDLKATQASSLFLTSSWIGFSSDPSGNINWINMGTYAIIWRNSALIGTSNATGMGFDGLPAEITPPQNREIVCLCVDIGWDALAVCKVGSDGLITFELVSIIPQGAEDHQGPIAAKFDPTGNKGLPQGWMVQYPL